MAAEADGPTSPEEFRQIGDQGYGTSANSYTWATAWFKGKLYIGTNHNFLCVTRSIRNTSEGAIPPEVPVQCPEDILTTDFRGRIYRYDPGTNQVELMYISPTAPVLRSDGTSIRLALDSGYRTMLVYRDPDGTEALYTGTFTSSETSSGPARLLRTTDGENWANVPLSITGGTTYTSLRALTEYKGRMFAIGLGRSPETTALIESADPASGQFRVISTPGFGDPEVNRGLFELAVFAGYLYIGTATSTEGYQLLKTQAVGTPPYVYQKVLVEGAYRGSSSQNVVSLYPYRDHLYVGSGINFIALDLFDDIKAQPAELVRVKADDSWEIVCGDARTTPDGYKTPITGQGPGCGNLFTGYIWRMVEHEGTLYMGTFDLSLFTQYFDGITQQQIRDSALYDRYPQLQPLIEPFNPDEIGDVVAAVEGGFDLWATNDGVDWQRVTGTGFSDSFSYGIRSFESTPFGLFVGTANPFFGTRLFLGQKAGTDHDGDSYPDAEDNCPMTWNLSQHDTDADGIRDACDDDADGDCIPDGSNPDEATVAAAQQDTDLDGILDGCDADDDNDSIPDRQDNCPTVSNYEQLDSDGDGIGDECDTQDPPPGQDNPGDEPAIPGLCGSGAATAFIAIMLVLSGVSLSQRTRSLSGPMRMRQS